MKDDAIAQLSDQVLALTARMQEHTYLINNSSKNSFHANNIDNTVNLDFFRA